MRYGPNLHEIDAAVRRKPAQSLKKAAPGAPFGWNTHNDEPYIGTRYAVRGDKFASVSTRNGGAGQYYWKPLSGVSHKVALSAIETHGKVEHLWAGEGRATLGEILGETELARIRSVFVRVLGAETLSKLESAGEEEGAEAEAEGESKAEVKAEAKAEAPAECKAEAPAAEGKATLKSDATAQTPEENAWAPTARVGAKRKARMAMVDELRGLENAKALARSTAAKARGARASARGGKSEAAEEGGELVD